MSAALALRLQPFYGYSELEMFDDANDELERLPDALKTQPMVLLCRLELPMMLKKWEDGVNLGQSLCGLWPKEFEFWFRTAFCLHEMKRTIEARQTLLDAPIQIRDMPVYSFNLACYETQLGDLETGKALLKVALEKNVALKETALDDPDLEPIWESLA